MFNLKFKCMRINDSCRGSKIFRALLILDAICPSGTNLQ